MKWQFPQWPELNFNFHSHNTDFVWWLQHHTPECLKWFQSSHYGLWEWPYKQGLLVTVIVKLPITDGSFHTIQHKEVIESFVHTCQQVSGLLSAFMAACDVMVSDYHGNQQSHTVWFKAVYMKFPSTRQEAAALILSEIPKLNCYENNQRIHWGAEMSGNNRPPPKKQDVLAVPQVQRSTWMDPMGALTSAPFKG